MYPRALLHKTHVYFRDKKGKGKITSKEAKQCFQKIRKKKGEIAKLYFEIWTKRIALFAVLPTWPFFEQFWNLPYFPQKGHNQGYLISRKWFPNQIISYFFCFSYTRFFFCHRAFDSARFRTQKCSLRRLVYHVLYLYDLHFASTPFTRMRCGRPDAGYYATSSGCQPQSEWSKYEQTSKYWLWLIT